MTKKKDNLKVKVDAKLQDHHKPNPLDQGLQHLLLISYMTETLRAKL